MCNTVCNHSQPAARPAPRQKTGRAPEKAYRVESVIKPDGSEEILSVSGTKQTVQQDEVVLRDLPYGLAEHEESTPELYRERYVAESALTPELRKKHDAQNLFKSTDPGWEGSEVKTIVDQGPSENRIDLTIVGDGYTDEEKTRFFEDAKRLTDDMFIGQTFASYLPLFNVHAVFVPSEESGVSDLERKDTALGLYRSPRGSKRGIMPGNRRATERAINLAPDTDYPILVANDEFYGGLGGRYAITTRSENSGTMVLRHELGHNFGNVGEEYDGGQVYRGANHSRSADLPWAHWLPGADDGDGDSKGHVHQAKALATGYPWENLNKGPITVDFKVPKGDAKGPMQVGIDISSVGWDGEGDVEVRIDGKLQKYEGVYTEDRSFFRLKEAQSLAEGNHKLTITEKNPDGNNVVAAVRINAYPADYDFTKDKVGGFPTFNHRGNHVGYRPTHESCLMRTMRETKFCSVDQENMWHQFLNRVDLIDSLDVKPGKSDSGVEQSLVTVNTPDLEGLDIRWFSQQTDENGQPKEVEVEALRGRKSWVAQKGEDSGDYRVEVNFSTDEVRRYSDRFSTDQQFSVA